MIIFTVKRLGELFAVDGDDDGDFFDDPSE